MYRKRVSFICAVVAICTSLFYVTTVTTTRKYTYYKLESFIRAVYTTLCTAANTTTNSVTYFKILELINLLFKLVVNQLHRSMNILKYLLLIFLCMDFNLAWFILLTV